MKTSTSLVFFPKVLSTSLPAEKLTRLDLEQKIETTKTLIADRKPIYSHAFQVGLRITGWKTLSASVECETLIRNCLVKNLNTYESRLSRLEDYAESQNWPILFFTESEID